MDTDISDSELERIVTHVVRRALGNRAAAPSAGSKGRRTVSIGADHRGQTLKEELEALLREQGFVVRDRSQGPSGSTDYPDIAEAVAVDVASGDSWRGIVIDAAGIGSCIAANKVPGARAALCYNRETANNSREHNNANILSLGSGLTGPTLAKAIVETWLDTPFAGGRHARRVDKIGDIERRYSQREQ